jgi:hypothetical protein
MKGQSKRLHKTLTNNSSDFNIYVFVNFVKLDKYI